MTPIFNINKYLLLGHNVVSLYLLHGAMRT